MFFLIVEYKCPGGSESLGQEVLYFQNADFPQGSTMPTMCIFSIAIKDSTICQIRYETYLSFLCKYFYFTFYD